MILYEIDGPPTGWFADTKGNKHWYVSYGLRSPDPGILICAFAKWCSEMMARPGNNIIVWRTRPEYFPDQEGMLRREENPDWCLFFRCALVPADLLMGAFSVPEKPEGANIIRQQYRGTP